MLDKEGTSGLEPVCHNCLDLSVPRDTSTKLSEWRNSEDSLIADASNGEILILNTTKIDHWRLEKDKENTALALPHP